LQRQAVTGLQLGGERIVFYVDISGGMVGRSAAELDQWQARPAAEQRAAPKWQQLVTTFERLTREVPCRLRAFKSSRSTYSALDGRRHR
jgi:hypothetical protein